MDVAIAGAGPAGAACAITLRALGRSVHLVDPREAAPRRRRATGETLFPGAVNLLERLGVAEAFRDSAPPECQSHGSAWGTSVPGEVSTLTNPNGRGWFLDRGQFDRILTDKALADGATATWASRLAVRGRGEDGRWDLSAGSAEVRARFLVDATGRSAAVARSLGIRRAQDDSLVAVTAELSGVVHEPASTFVETCAYGWWYACPSAPGALVVTLMTDADLLRSLGASDLDTFCALYGATQASRRFEVRGPLSSGEVPHVCSAATGHAWPAAGDGWALAGDAALSFDPLSSRGISAALLSGLHLGHAIDAWLSGQRGELRRYTDTLRRVHADHRRIQAAYYRMERRYPEETFWARRLPAAEKNDEREPVSLQQNAQDPR